MLSGTLRRNRLPGDRLLNLSGACHLFVMEGEPSHLAAVDEEEHLKNMRQLFLILSDEELLEKLAQANTAEELLELDQLLS